jgi:hypothetical protein
MQSNLKTTLFIAAATLFAIAGTQAQAGGAGLDAALLASMQDSGDQPADPAETLTQAAEAAGELLGLDD